VNEPGSALRFPRRNSTGEREFTERTSAGDCSDRASFEDLWGGARRFATRSVEWCDRLPGAYKLPSLQGPAPRGSGRGAAAWSLTPGSRQPHHGRNYPHHEGTFPLGSLPRTPACRCGRGGGRDRATFWVRILAASLVGLRSRNHPRVLDDGARECGRLVVGHVCTLLAGAACGVDVGAAVSTRLRKGRLIGVAGSLRQAEWTDDCGQRDERHYMSAGNIDFLDRLADAGGVKRRAGSGAIAPSVEGPVARRRGRET
jgi:hypothetical protein